MAWYKESRRHSLASRGVKTASSPSARIAEKAYIPRTTSIRTVIQANERAGNHFFDKETIDFFNSRVQSIAYYKKGSTNEGYFITSEQFELRGEKSPREYTIRSFNLSTGDVDTVGEFQAYATNAQATSAIKKLLGGKVKSQRPFRWERSQQYRNAKQEDINKFVGLKSKPYEGRSFTIDEKDARLIVANLKKSEYNDYKKKFQNGTKSDFRLLQDYAGEYS